MWDRLITLVTLDEPALGRSAWDDRPAPPLSARHPGDEEDLDDEIEEDDEDLDDDFDDEDDLDDDFEDDEDIDDEIDEEIDDIDIDEDEDEDLDEDEEEDLDEDEEASTRICEITAAVVSGPPQGDAERAGARVSVHRGLRHRA